MTLFRARLRKQTTRSHQATNRQRLRNGLRRRLLTEQLEDRRLLAGLATMIEDSVALGGIGPAGQNAGANNLVVVGSQTYFTASDGVNGVELWRVGSSGPAQMIEKNGSAGIAAGAASSSPTWLTNVAGTLFFRANDGINGDELWRINAAGTAEMVDDAASGVGIIPGNTTSGPASLTAVGSTLYFVANDSFNGAELWKVNSTGVATMIEDSIPGGGIAPGVASSQIGDLFNLSGTLYFSASLNGDDELWRINGSGIAEMVEDSVAGGGISSFSSSYPSRLTNVNGTLYFSARGTNTGEELWRINASGIAELVEDISPGGGLAPGSAGSTPNSLINVGGTLFFNATNTTNGRELWRINSAGLAVLVEDSVPGGGIASGNFDSYPQRLTNVNGTLYFVADDLANGAEVWRVNASNIAEMVSKSAAGTGIRPGIASPFPQLLTNVGGTLYFKANDGTTGYELWRVNSSGFAELVEDVVPGEGINPGASGSDPLGLINVQGVLYFSATTLASGTELWQIRDDGIAEMIEDGVPGGGINPGAAHSLPTNLFNFNGTLLFLANDGSNGIELWQTTPASAPTNVLLSATSIAENSPVGTLVGMLSSVDSNAGDTFSYSLVPIEGQTDHTHFTINENELRTATTIDFESKTSYSISLRTTDQSGLSYTRSFVITVTDVQDTPGMAVMIEDGIALGGINNAVGLGSNPELLTAVGDTLYFAATDSLFGRELWRLNAQGLAELVSAAGGGINPGIADANPANLTNFNGTLFFTADHDVLGRELWRINSSGLAELVEALPGGGGIGPGSDASNPAVLTVAGNWLYFRATNSDGQELWRVGTTGTAELIEDSLPGGGINANSDSYPRYLTNVNGTLYFVANGGGNYDKLWKINSSGIAEMVEDSVPGPGVDPQEHNFYSLTNLNGQLYFGTTRETWRINEAGIAETIEDSDPGDGINSKGPTSFVSVNGTVYFGSIDVARTSLWRINSAGLAELVEDSIPGGGISPNVTNWSPRELVNVNGTLYFNAKETNTTYRMWRINNMGQAEVVPGNVDGPGFGALFNDTYYFQGGHNASGLELWRLNASGTIEIVEDAVPGGGIAPGSEGSHPRQLTNVNGVIYFMAYDTPFGHELWRINSSGIAEMVEDSLPGVGINPGSASSVPYNLVNLNGTLYFTADDGSNGYELWRVIPEPNSAPTDIQLSNNTIAENAPNGTIVGTLSSVDPNTGSSFSYTLVPIQGSNDHTKFAMQGPNLRTATTFDFETRSSYTVRIRTTDSSNLSFEKTFVISVTDVAEAPTAIFLSGNQLAENTPINTTIATLSAAGANTSSTLFELTSGFDNAHFEVVGNTLQNTSLFNYEAASSYTIQLRATSAGVAIVREFVILITPVNEFNPQFITTSLLQINENVQLVGLLTASDADLPTAPLTFSISGGADAARFGLNGSQLSFLTAPNFEVRTDSNLDNRYEVTVTVTDGTRSQTLPLTVTVNNVNDAPHNVVLSNSSINESQSGGTVVGNLVASDEDLTSQTPFTFSFSSLITPNDNSDFEIVGNQLRSRRPFDYESLADREFTVRLVARDASGATSQPVALNISTQNLDELPIANAQSLSLNANTSVGITLTGTDGTGSPAVTYSISRQPTRGVLSGTAPNLVYTPHANVTGADQFYFRVSASGQQSYEARVELQIIGVKPVISFSTLSSSFDEAAGSVTVGITISPPATTNFYIPATVGFPYTASIGNDITVEGVFVAAGQTQAFFNVIIKDDTIHETNEFLDLRLQPFSFDYILGNSPSHVLTIIDNEPRPTLSLNTKSIVTSEARGTFIFDVLLTAPTTEAISIPVSVIGGSAVAGVDFAQIVSNITIPAGGRRGSLPITLIDDDVEELEEQIIVQFGASDHWPADLTPLGRTIQWTIRDDDRQTASLRLTRQTVTENVGSVQISATLSEIPTETITVPFVLSGDALRDGALADYVHNGVQEFVFAPGQTTAFQTISIVDDNRTENSESIELLLTASTSYALGSTHRMQITIRDNDQAVINFNSATYQIAESGGSIVITATLDRPLTTSITVPIQLSTGFFGSTYASLDNDFSFPTPSFEFPAGVQTATRTITIADDSLTEVTEIVSLYFSTSFQGTALPIVRGVNGSSTLSILDNDAALSIEAENTYVAESNSSEAVFVISLSSPVNYAIDIPLTFSGTARPGIQYTQPVSQVVRIEAFSQQVIYRIPLLDDNLSTTFSAVLTVSIDSETELPVGVVARSASVVIENNDFVVVNFPADIEAVRDVAEDRIGVGETYTFREEVITVQLSAPADRTIEVLLYISGNNVYRYSDYLVNGNVEFQESFHELLIIPEGFTQASFVITIIDDSEVEGDEYLDITIVTSSEGSVVPTKLPVRTLRIVDSDNGLPSVARTVSSSCIPALDADISLSARGDVSQQGVSNSCPPTTAEPDSTIVRTNTRLVWNGNNGPIQGALAFFDANLNGVHDFLDTDKDGLQDANELSEPARTTALDGAFSLVLDEFDVDKSGVIEPDEGRLVLTGGTDISSGLAWRIPLTAPIGLFNLTPISTLVENLIRTQGLTVDAAIAKATAALGIPTYNLPGSNSIYEVLSMDPLAAQAYSAHTKLYSTVIAVAQLLTGATVAEQRDLRSVGDQVFSTISSLIVADSSLLSLTDALTIQSIIRGTISNQTLSEAAIEVAATVISGGIQRMAEVQLADHASGHQFLTKISQIKTVLQGDLADALFSLSSGSLSTAQVQTQYSGTALTSKINSVVSQISVPPVIGVSSLGVVETNSGSSVMRFQVRLLGEHAYEVSTAFATVAGSATPGQDYTHTSGRVTWPANDNADKFIDVTILGDTSFEADEYLKLLLSDGVGLVIRQTDGYGFILNDDAGQIASLTPGIPENYYLTLAADRLDVVSNAVERLSGEFLNGFGLTLSGQNVIDDQWTLDFVANTYRNDTYILEGGLAGQDKFTALAGVFNTIELNLAANAVTPDAIRFVPDLAEDAVVANLNDVESVDLSISKVDELVINVPATVAQLILEDADPATSGKMRVRSPSGSFPTFEFTNPQTRIRIVRESAATQLTVSRDAAFVGEIDQGAVDDTPPVSAIAALPAVSTSQAILLTVNGTDSASGGVAATGIKEFELYVSTGSGFQKIATLTPTQNTTMFIGNANTNYWFRSLAIDNAGNIEIKDFVDTYTRIGDVVPPSSNVTQVSAPSASGLFTLQMMGSKVSGSPLTHFDVYVSIDNAPSMMVGSAIANSNGGGSYSGTLSYQGLADNIPHNYSFYSRARDGAGNNESAPSIGDISVNATISSAMTASGINVQNGANQRSYIRNLDVLFSSASGLDELLAQGRVKIERFAIDAPAVVPGTGVPVLPVGVVRDGSNLKFDFGASGLGGLRQLGNGFYRVLVSLDGNNTFTDAADKYFEFHRLFGDADGNGKVEVTDTDLVSSQMGQVGFTLNGDLDGNGLVNGTDRMYSIQQRNKRLHDYMLLMLDD